MVTKKAAAPVAPTPPDFWAPFRKGFKQFVAETRKATAAGVAGGLAAAGPVLGTEIASGHFDVATGVWPLVGLFVGGFVVAWAAAYSTTNATA